jgi:hypothetical protein
LTIGLLLDFLLLLLPLPLPLPVLVCKGLLLLLLLLLLLRLLLPKMSCWLVAAMPPSLPMFADILLSV